MAEEGGLIGYGARLHLIYRQLAAVLVKVLHGIKPEDIPVEAPTKFDLVVNLKTAKAAWAILARPRRRSDRMRQRDVADWHIASFRVQAAIRSLL